MKQSMLTEGLVPTGDAKLDAKAAKEYVLFPHYNLASLFTSFASLESQIAKLKRNQERRIDRKNKKIAKEGGEPLLTAPVVKSETSRKCGNCGEMGHMSTYISDSTCPPATDLFCQKLIANVHGGTSSTRPHQLTRTRLLPHRHSSPEWTRALLLHPASSPLKMLLLPRPRARRRLLLHLHRHRSQGPPSHLVSRPLIHPKRIRRWRPVRRSSRPQHMEGR